MAKGDSADSAGKYEMYTLYARAGWGSALIETQLAWYGLPYRLEGIGDLFKEEAAGEKLRPVNPLMQLPTLVLPDGQIMTESAAITLYLAEATGRSDLVPPPPRPQFLRWLVFVPTSTRRTPMPTFPDGLWRARRRGELSRPTSTRTRGGFGR
jgi:glutathione S-transferase